MTTHRKIVQLANGKYVREWQYSQGHFDVEETEDIFKACEVGAEQFERFFQEKGAKSLTIKLSATIISR